MNTTSNSSPLALCRVIQGDRRIVFVVFVLLGDQGDLLEEVGQRALRVALLELLGHPDQLLEVLDPAHRLDRSLLLELGRVARERERLLHHPGHACPAGQQRAKFVEQV